MRSFALFVALLAGSLLLAAALTYPAWLLVATISVEPVHRVMNRLAMLIALIGLIALTRRLGLATRAAAGYALPWRQLMRQAALGWLGGIALMAPLIGLLLMLDVRELRPDAGGALLGLVAGALLAGLVVALIEETFFRGVLYSAVAGASGTTAAVLAPSVLYAALHFLGGRLRIAADEVRWHHGFTVLGRLFERYAQPLELIDSFLALLMLGVLFALLRRRTGAIAAGIGLHAAGVFSIALLRRLTVVDAAAPYAGLVGSYDGVIGWAALAWFAVIALAVTRAGRGNSG